MRYEQVREGVLTHNAAAKATPVDADEISVADSADQWIAKRVTVGSLKAGSATPKVSGIYDVNGRLAISVPAALVADAVKDAVSLDKKPRSKKSAESAEDAPQETGDLEGHVALEERLADNHVEIANSNAGTAPKISAKGTDANVNLDLAGKGTGVVRANGAEVLTAASAGASRLVGATAQGSSGAENGANAWAKIATLDPGTAVNTDASVVLSVVCAYASAHASAIVSLYTRSNATGNPTVDVQLVSRAGSGPHLAPDSFKAISNGLNTPVELWVRKAATFGQFTVYELSRNVKTGYTVTYPASAAWQSAVPTGTGVNVSSTGVTVAGNTVATKVAVPASAAAPGLPGQWAASTLHYFVYTGNGTTHSWGRAALETTWAVTVPGEVAVDPVEPE
jgi:hypothetical protein